MTVKEATKRATYSSVFLLDMGQNVFFNMTRNFKFDKKLHTKLQRVCVLNTDLQS